MTKLESKFEQWLKEYLVKNQEGNTTNPVCVCPEENARFDLAKKFDISTNYAYKIIKQLAEDNMHFKLTKETVEGFQGLKIKMFALTYLD